MSKLLKLGLCATLMVFLIIVTSDFAQSGQETPDGLVNEMVANINSKNKKGVESLIHPQVVSYLRVTDPAMLENISNSLMQLKIPPDYKMGVISINDLGNSGMASYDAATQTLTMMGSAAYYKIPPTHLMALVEEREKIVEVDGKEEKKMVKIPLTPTPLPIAQYNGSWYIVIAVGKK